MFLIDTCFCSHLKEIYDQEKIDLRSYLFNFPLGITEDLRKELEHFDLFEFIPFDKFYLISYSTSDFSNFQIDHVIIKNFDLADQGLLFLGKRDNGIILSDDYDLMVEASTLGLKVLRLPSFCLYLFKENILPKKIFNQILHFWDINHLYSLKELDRIKKEMHNLH